jgi:hypothetical protein
LSTTIWTAGAGDTKGRAELVPGFERNRENGGRSITQDKACFVAGTKILTPYCDTPVQDLRPGDEVLTLRSGAEAVQKIIWTGRRVVDLARHANPERVTPVRFQAGGLGDGLPEYDLKLSPDHCLFVDGHLIEAKTLVNGATILPDPSQRYVSYHHIELARHDIILAEGVPAETFLDSGNRAMFEGAPALALHVDFAARQRQGSIAPVVRDGPVVSAYRQRLLDHAIAIGFAVTDATDLWVKAGVEKLQPEPCSAPQCLIYELSQPYREVELHSSAGVPAHLSAAPDDRRKLGAAITAMFLLTAGRRCKIRLDDPRHSGFYPAEQGHHWTDGAARVALPPYRGPAQLEIRLKGQAARWAAAKQGAAATA